MICKRCGTENYEMVGPFKIPKEITACSICGYKHYKELNELGAGESYVTDLTVIKTKKGRVTVIQIEGSRFVYEPQ